MKTIFSIDGGIGRVMCSIPALLKYAKNHPEEEWYIMAYAWEFCFWGIEELQPRVLHPEAKGVFETYYWNADRVIHPEPYKLPAYYRNEVSLAVAFDKLINETDDHSDLPDIMLETSLDEMMRAKTIIGQAAYGKFGDGIQNKKIIVFQPYGSGVQKTDIGFYDKSMRSITDVFASEIVNALKDDYIIINMNGANNWSYFQGAINIQEELDIRTWIALIQEADYFIGCDSCGQHIAKAVGTPASVFVAGTHEVNVSYPNDFHIIKNDSKFYPVPLRLSDNTCHLSERLNQKRAIFTQEEIKSHIRDIIDRIEGRKKTKKVKEIQE